jgi:ubiquinone/menaquinone biosynthesis C-methylase UbiE
MEFDMEIIEHYSRGNEENRLTGISLEKIRTQEIIKRHIPEPPAKVLDVGGANGVYSFWLSQNGYEVHLIDIVPLHIEQAKEYSEQTKIQLNSCIVGDARELPFSDSCFDVVLLMGPLYHLTEKRDRLKALNEAKRVLKPGGIVICAVISRFGSMLEGFHYGLVSDPQFVTMMNRDLICGQHRNEYKKEGYFTTAFLHHPEELKEEIADSGIDLVGLFAVEGFACRIPEVDKKCEDKNYLETLLETLRKIECENTLLGVSSHFIGIGKKKY